MTNRPTIYDYPQVAERAGLQLGHFGCIMLDVQPIPISAVLTSAFRDVNLDEIYYHSDHPILRYVKGPVAEDGAHVTLLYGLTPDDNAGIAQKESVDELLSGLDLHSVEIKEVHAFPPQFGLPYACVVGRLKVTWDLAEANRRLRFLPHVDTFVEYAPHVTLAYVHEDYRDAVINALHYELVDEKLAARGINYGGPIS